MSAEEGHPAPDFSLPATNGGNASLGDYAGNILVIFFYPRDDTSGCTREAIAFSQLEPAFREAGAQILGVSPDTLAKHEKFRAKHDITVTLGSDETHAMLEAYGVWVEKSMYGRKYMGVERSTFIIGRDGRIARAWRKVKVAGHAEEVLAAVQSMA